MMELQPTMLPPSN
jgi:hypothetical protein